MDRECLHRGELWQFSAQYGGWLRLRLLLFSDALVVDPDNVDTRRRNSLKLWMDLCLVQNVTRIVKEDGLLRRNSHGSQSANDAKFRFAVHLGAQQQPLRFATATFAQRVEWMHCLQLAAKLQEKEELHQDAFLRFASSGSESEEEVEAEENRLSSPPTSWSEQNALRSAQILLAQQKHSTNLQAESAKSPVSLVILRVTATDENGHSVSTVVPVSETSQGSVSVHQVKLNAIKQLQIELRRSVNDDKTSTPGFLKSILHRQADTFVLYCDIGDQWLTDEQQPIGRYIFGCAKRRVQLALFPMNKMPQATIDLAIVGTKKKVSDLSQRSYTSYVIDVSFNGSVWQLSRRYKEFDALRSHLKTKYPSVELPGLPPKHVFTPLEGEFITTRKEQLEAFLKQLLLHPVTSADVMLMSFLGVVSISRDPELGHREKSVIHVTSLHESIACGDIILFSCRFGASRLQRKFTGSKYDHVGIVVPGESRFLLRIMEATSEGIQVYSLKARLMAYAREVSNSIVVRKVAAERTPELLEQLQEFVRSVDGNPYSILGILRSAGESNRNIFGSVRIANRTSEAAEEAFSTTGSSTSSAPSSPMTEDADLTKSQDNKRKYFCSSLVASAWKELGWLQTKRSSSSFWPGSFEDGGEVEQLLAPSVSLAPETVIDCRIVEVGLAAQTEA